MSTRQRAFSNCTCGVNLLAEIEFIRKKIGIKVLLDHGATVYCVHINYLKIFDLVAN